MPRQKRSASLGERPFGAFAGVQLCGRGQEPFGIGRVTQQVRRFLKGLKVFKGEHDHGLVTVSGDDERLMVVAHAIHRASQVCSG